jgi:hypothetical protein
MTPQEPESSGPPRLLRYVFLVLGAFGALSIWTSVKILLSTEADPTTAIGPLLSGVTLLGVGLVVPTVLRRRQAAVAAREQRRAADPDRPWTWREEWASGRISGGGYAAAVGLWLFAGVWNVFTWPAAWLVLSRSGDEEGVYFVLLFPAAGAFLLLVAVRATLQQRKYGRSYVTLQTHPGVIGRTLEGEIQTSLTDVPPDGVEVRLSCIQHYQTGRPGHRKTEKRTIWQDHVTVPSADLSREMTGLRIPVAFEIPAHLPPCSDNSAPDQVVWQLAVSAAMPGIDYADSFDVPVFDTGVPPLTAAERERLRRPRQAQARAYAPDDPVVRVSQTARGGTTFFCKPRVTLLSGLGMVAMTIGCWVGTWYLYAADVPIAPFFVAFFALLFTIGSVVALSHRAWTTVEDGEVVISHRILGLGPTRRFQATEISRVFVEVVGEGTAQTWEVKVQVTDGASHGAAAHIPTQLEADWTAEQMRAAITRMRPTTRSRTTADLL